MEDHVGRCTRTSHSLDTSLEQASPCVLSLYLNIDRFSTFLGHFTPWQIVVSTLTAVYAMRNADKLIGLGGKSWKVRFRIPVMLKLPLKPCTALEPLARLVSIIRSLIFLIRCN